ncbi:MAG: 30S ribosomal protein S1, partial [Deltaproteobacteria bacterium CG_4_9_14_3_um_filter_44_9]
MEKEADVVQNKDSIYDRKDADTDTTSRNKSSDADESFEQLYENSLNKLQEGEVVRGKVIQITENNIMVDVGYKSEGQVSTKEFLNERGELTVNIGDEVDVLLERREDKNGSVVLSKNKADKLKVWDEISRIFDEDNVIEGEIVSRVKGGFAVDIGVNAFLPGSQVDLRPVRNFEESIGKKFNFKIIKFNKKQGNIVLSRRAIMEKEREGLRKRTLKTLEEGQIIEGTVKNITDYGVFIDLGGIDGLLHITDLSWGKITHPQDLCSIGDKLKAKVIKFDRENERVSLGLKQITPAPWTSADEKYPIGSRVKGKVVGLADYGAFIRLEEG